MLCDLPTRKIPRYDSNDLTNLVIKLLDDDKEPVHIATGVYEAGFNWDRVIRKFLAADAIDLCLDTDFRGRGIIFYGVCDSWEQIVEECPRLQADREPYVIRITPVVKGDNGGWRWHKWGPYIGVHSPEYEYLDDEPAIEKVYTFSIHLLREPRDINAQETN